MTRTLLFVDDYVMLRTIYSEILTDAGYRVIGASDDKECAEALIQEIPDLILLDIMMKPVDGWEVLQQIRKNPKTVETPVIMVSGKALLPLEITRYGPQIDGYLRKPLQNVHLITSLSDYFTWYDALRSRCFAASSAGVSSEAISKFFILKRQMRTLEQLVALIHREYDRSPDSFSGELISEEIANITTYVKGIRDQLMLAEQNIP
ncbi:MAG TPA: response regulator [Methanospirillum sp.]|nr:response regulator [Methanospirillum sp.]